MSKGYVYILSNECMPGIVKIGRTTRSVSGRANELYQTGVPTPFAVEHEVYCLDCEKAEQEIHDVFSDERVNPNREFFRADADRVFEILAGLAYSHLNDFVKSFYEDCTVTTESTTVDALHLYNLSQKLDRHPYEVISGIELLTADEVKIGLDRYDERVKEFSQKSDTVVSMAERK